MKLMPHPDSLLTCREDIMEAVERFKKEFGK